MRRVIGFVFVALAVIGLTRLSSPDVAFTLILVAAVVLVADVPIAAFRSVGKEVPSGGTRATRAVTRLATVAVLAVCIAVVAFSSRPSRLPAAAMGSQWFLRAEWGFGLLVAGLLVLVVAIRGVVFAQVPLRVSRDGPEYPDGALEASGGSLKAVNERLDRLAEKSDAAFEGLSKRVTELESR